ncbi:hypothetical protein V1478_001102 [Vespula squamosa]|uniref:Uncharacterized protein n=1 Tax=Vespula squamosa TaxID=30214 RepID=A0ABD2C7D2_VESSQ
MDTHATYNDVGRHKNLTVVFRAYDDNDNDNDNDKDEDEDEDENEVGYDDENDETLRHTCMHLYLFELVSLTITDVLRADLSNVTIAFVRSVVFEGRDATDKTAAMVNRIRMLQLLSMEVDEIVQRMKEREIPETLLSVVLLWFTARRRKLPERFAYSSQ